MARKKVYVVWVGDWDSMTVESIWSSRKAAEKRVGKMLGIPASVEEFPVYNASEVVSVEIKERR